MRIAFDLDDTLIPALHRFPTERKPAWSRLLPCEPLRLGTINLFRELTRARHELGIYTSSLRSPIGVRWTFALHGIRLGLIVTGADHATITGSTSSKYPPAFGFDLLIDDSEGLLIEARERRFAVLRVDPNDADWVWVVLRGVAESDDRRRNR